MGGLPLEGMSLNRFAIEAIETMTNEIMHLVVIIVQQKLEPKALAAIEGAGAGGATILYGKGKGIRNKMGNWGLLIQPEKAVILTIVPEPAVKNVIEAVKRAASLNSPGNGVAFSLKISDATGLFVL